MDCPVWRAIAYLMQQRVGRESSRAVVSSVFEISEGDDCASMPDASVRNGGVLSLVIGPCGGMVALTRGFGFEGARTVVTMAREDSRPTVLGLSCFSGYSYAPSMHDSSAAPNFTTTHWSLVLAAKSDAVSQSRAHQALGALCQAYWFPLYAFIRRSGYAAADAQDLTQSFLLAFIEKQGFSTADPERGRFRSYLLGALKHFLAHDRERRSAKKRGGDVAVVELDALEPEARYQLEPISAVDPEASFNRDWAQEVNARALEKLQSEYRRQGKQRQFAVLEGCLVDDGFDRNKAAQEIGGTDGATKVAIHRLRKRYRELLRSEVSVTLNDPEELDDEMRCLLSALVAV